MFLCYFIFCQSIKNDVTTLRKILLYVVFQYLLYNYGLQWPSGCRPYLCLLCLSIFHFIFVNVLIKLVHHPVQTCLRPVTYRKFISVPIRYDFLKDVVRHNAVYIGGMRYFITGDNRNDLLCYHGWRCQN